MQAYAGGWTFDSNGYAYYTFTVGGDVTSVKKDLPLKASRTLVLNYYSLYLYKDTTKKLVSTVAPALEDYETITYVSSNPDIVEVTSDGTLIYKSDGDATITVSVPACDGGDDVTATCTVYARQTTYSIRLHAGDNVTLSSSEYTLSSGVYIGSYTYGTTYYLPTAASMTKANEEYYFDGWYDNAGFTGSKIKDYIYFKLRLRQQGVLRQVAPMRSGL
ncbi:MAG: Ig-like domain-containing protein [Eubacteriales bacterium]